MKAKKYPLTFTNDHEYQAYNESVKEHSEKRKFVEQWEGKKITLQEAEEHIDEFDEIIFNGETIEIYNDYKE